MTYKVNDITQIIRETCEEDQVIFEQLKVRRGNTNIVNARAVVMYRLRNELDMTLAQVGEVFGKDHSTVISALKRINQKPTK